MSNTTHPVCPFQLETIDAYDAKPNGWCHSPVQVRYPVKIRGVDRVTATYFTVKFKVRVGDQYLRMPMGMARHVTFTDPTAERGSEKRRHKEFDYPHDAFAWASQIPGAVVEPYIMEFCYA